MFVVSEDSLRLTLYFRKMVSANSVSRCERKSSHWWSTSSGCPSKSEVGCCAKGKRASASKPFTVISASTVLVEGNSTRVVGTSSSHNVSENECKTKDETKLLNAKITVLQSNYIDSHLLLKSAFSSDLCRKRLPTFPYINAICTGHEYQLINRNFTTLKPKSVQALMTDLE